jgi:AraC family transcriptional regulator, transcriptional activator of the genes for pyochelin and ferripyochelin receptors
MYIQRQQVLNGLMILNLSPYDIECLEKAKQLIEADLSQHISIADLAQKVALGTTKLKNGFAQQYGTPIYSYLRTIRMLKAVELLTDSNKTVKEIARLTGFKHKNNFTSAFNRYHGFTPGMLRKGQSNK